MTTTVKKPLWTNLTTDEIKARNKETKKHNDIVDQINKAHREDTSGDENWILPIIRLAEQDPKVLTALLTLCHELEAGIDEDDLENAESYKTYMDEVGAWLKRYIDFEGQELYFISIHYRFAGVLLAGWFHSGDYKNVGDALYH